LVGDRGNDQRREEKNNGEHAEGSHRWTSTVWVENSRG